MAQRLADSYPETAHVQDCGLGSADDEDVWQFAAAHGYLLVSKGIDFHDRSMLLIQRFLADQEQSLLILR